MEQTVDRVNIKQLAEFLGVTVSTVRKRTMKGKLPDPVARNGGWLHWERSDLHHWGINI